MAKPVLLRASMLRPSAFSAQLFGSSGTTTSTTTTTWPTGEEKAAEPVVETTDKAEAQEPAEDPLKLLTKSNGLAKSNPFTAVQVTPLSSDSGFVFGQNTRDRVTGNVEDDTSKSNGDLSFSNTPAAEGQSGSGGGTEAGGPSGDGHKEKGDASGKSLSEVAREYEENKNARKRKFDEVETFTGEEDEINVLDVSSVTNHG